MEPPRPASTSKSPWSGIGALEVQELGDEDEEAGGAGLEGRHRPFQFTCCRFTVFLLVLSLYGMVSAYKSTIFYYYIRSLVACDEVMHPQCTAVRKNCQLRCVFPTHARIVRGLKRVRRSFAHLELRLVLPLVPHSLLAFHVHPLSVSPLPFPSLRLFPTVSPSPSPLPVPHPTLPHLAPKWSLEPVILTDNATGRTTPAMNATTGEPLMYNKTWTAVNKSAPGWSGSDLCNNTQETTSEGQTVKNMASGAGIIAALLFVPALGGLSDSIGRRPVMLLGALGQVLTLVFITLAEMTGKGAFTMNVIGAVITGCTGVFMASATAIVVDSTPEATDRIHGRPESVRSRERMDLLIFVGFFCVSYRI